MPKVGEPTTENHIHADLPSAVSINTCVINGVELEHAENIQVLNEHSSNIHQVIRGIS